MVRVAPLDRPTVARLASQLRQTGGVAMSAARPAVTGQYSDGLTVVAESTDALQAGEYVAHFAVRARFRLRAP
jgi:hypothetical protein